MSAGRSAPSATNETAAQLAGVNVSRYRIYAATIGSAMIGLTGALLAYSAGFISPATYSFDRVDVRVLVLVAFGGLGTLLGPVLGAGVFAILDERLTASLELREVLYGVFVIAIFLGFRHGVVHAIVALYDRLGGPRRDVRSQTSNRLASRRLRLCHAVTTRTRRPRRRRSGSASSSLLSGAFKPRERVAVFRLVEELGVSRTPLRTALVTLEHEGSSRDTPRRRVRRT